MSRQLGIGYNSQEPTRGLVEGFEGDYIEEVKCGITSSYIKVRQGDKSVLYSCGNKYRGQIGIKPGTRDDGSPMQSFQAKAKLVEGITSSVKMLAVGYEHALALTDEGTLLGTGINSDGQLGTGDDADRHIFSEIPLPEQLQEDGIQSIQAGADTSAIISKEGDLWSFGNSEYGQAFHGEKIDRVLSPKVMDWALIGLPKVRSFVTGGSFSVLLNDQGLVYSAGFGAIGQGEDTLETVIPKRIMGLEDIQSVYASNGYAAAVDSRQKFYTFGLNTEFGALGASTTSNLMTPQEIDMNPLLGNGDFEIKKIALGKDTAFVLVKQL